MNLNERESNLRLIIRRHHEGLAAIVAGLQSREPIIRGSIYTRRRQCGKPRCRCLRGHPHQDRVLAVRREGRVSVRGLDPAADAGLEDGVAAWHGFRRQRGELAAACRGLLRAVDRLAALRLARAGAAR
jgi:hypothetical protein